MTFIEDAEKALEPIATGWGLTCDARNEADVTRCERIETLLHQAITEVRGRDEAAGFMQWVIDKLKAENAELREAIEYALSLPPEEEMRLRTHARLRAALTPDPEAGKTVKVFVTHGTSWRGDVLGSDPSNSITVDGE